MAQSNQIKNLRVLVIGLGISGQSAARFLLNRGAKVTGIDRNWSLLQSEKTIGDLRSRGMEALHESQLCDAGHFDLVVVSPGIKLDHPLCQKALSAGIEVIGEVELACRDISQKCLGITGTNGKTTVTLMTEHVLVSSGKKARALGNVGIPLTSALDEASAAEIFVVELSSFQLETLNRRFLDAAVLLNVTPDHLDRYPSMQEYAQAKISIKDHLKPGGRFFVEKKCREEFHQLFHSGECLTYGYSEDCYSHTDLIDAFIERKKVFTLPAQYKGIRSHDLENLLASYALCREMGVSTEQFIEGIMTFKKPSHRIEFVRNISGIRFYDDSKGTNIDAVIRAVEMFNDKIILIAGGVDKGSPYIPWIKAFAGKVKSVCAIGQAAQKIHQELNEYIPVECFATLEEAVTNAVGIARNGDIVLLSPGCSSYDMFKDYAHRGEEFQRIVNAL